MEGKGCWEDYPCRVNNRTYGSVGAADMRISLTPNSSLKGTNRDARR